MPLFSKQGRFVYFIHIPKTGGSYIENVAQQNGWDAHFLLKGTPFADSHFMPVSPQHFHAELLEQIFDFSKGIEIFTIVRNPFDRLKSEYYWQRRHQITDAAVEDWIPRVMEEYSENPNVYRNHIRPQVDFLPTTAKAQVFMLESDSVSQSLLFLSPNPKKIQIFCM